MRRIKSEDGRVSPEEHAMRLLPQKPRHEHKWHYVDNLFSLKEGWTRHKFICIANKNGKPCGKVEVVSE